LTLSLVNADWNFWPAGWAPAAIWAACAQLGFDAMEVGVYDPDVELAPDRMKEVVELAARHGIGLHAVLFSMPPARWPEGALASSEHAGVAVRAIVETARRAADLGAAVLGVWPGADPPGGGAGAWARTVASMASIADEVAPLGLTVAVEPKPGQVVGDSDDALRLCEEADRAALGVLLDTAHALAGGEALARLPAGIGDRLVHVHLGDADEGDADADLPPGQLHDFAPFLLALERVGYPGALSFDLYGAVSGGGLTGEDASRRGLAHVTAALAGGE
jgi:sugar phosphate isomerase/epimerase